MFESPRERWIRRTAITLATSAGLLLCAWLASLPGQAEDAPAWNDGMRKPITCTDAAGIIYERGTPGFERCLKEYQPHEQAGQAEEPPRRRKLFRKATPTPRGSPLPTGTPTTTPTAAPEAIE